MNFLIRNHDKTLFNKQKEDFINGIIAGSGNSQDTRECLKNISILGKEDIMSNAFVCIMGIGTVFFGLVCLIFITMLVSKVVKMIEKPHSFSTACNIATQIIAQVASSQYGGQSISLTHLAPFVQVSREKITKEREKIYNTAKQETKRIVADKLSEAEEIIDELKNSNIEVFEYSGTCN